MEIQTDLNIKKWGLITVPQFLQYLLYPSINAASFLSRIQMLHVLLLRKAKLIKPLKNARVKEERHGLSSVTQQHPNSSTMLEPHCSKCHRKYLMLSGS